MINDSVITFLGSKARVVCDRNCNKAWGVNSRPKEQLSGNGDDFCFLSDGEVGNAPKNPGTYEGGCSKPPSPDGFPNKWCVRECERCSISEPNEWNLPLEQKSFVDRQYNMVRKEGEMTDQELFEKLKREGECWHVLGEHQRRCVVCNKILFTGTFQDKTKINPDFSTPDGKFWLLERTPKEFFLEFKYINVELLLYKTKYVEALKQYLGN